MRSHMDVSEWYLGSSPSGPDVSRPWDRPFVFPTKLEESCSFSKVSGSPYINILISSWFKKKEPRYECPSEASLALTLTYNMNWGFLLSTTLPINGVITHSHYIQMSPQSVVPS